MTAHPAFADLTDDDLAASLAAELAALGVSEDELVDGCVEDIERWNRIEVEYPIAAALLWQRPDAEWDQRRLVGALSGMLTLVRGGNRSGKTFAILQFCVAMALGGDHPAVIAWLADNDLPDDLIPDGPGEVVMAAPTAAQSIQFHRKRLAPLLPDGGVQWWGMDTPTAAARVEMAVAGYDKPGIIWFKSYDQEHRAFKGTEARLYALSEEPEGREGELILEECLRGSSSVPGGRVVLEMTPQNGFTWVFEKLHEQGAYNCKSIEIDSSHNVLAPDHEGVLRWLATLTPEQREMRQKGRFTNLEGLIYSNWSRGNGERFGHGNLCEPFDIPDDWPRFRGGDYGLSAATCIGWLALGDDNTLYLYRYLHEPSPTFQIHAEYVRRIEVATGEVIEAGWGDPSSPGESANRIFSQNDVPMHTAHKEVIGGISKVAERLRLWPDGRPRFKVFTGLQPKEAALHDGSWSTYIAGCRVGLSSIPKDKRARGDVFVSEMESYRWDPNVKSPTPLKKNDHGMDMLRYAVVGVDAWLGL